MSKGPLPAFDIKEYLAQKKEMIDRALDHLLPAESLRIVEAMRYSLLAGGKRLRPVLCLAAAESVGGDIGEVLDAACALEMIHTYSLIHDDLPVMDDDDYRRGRLTCHKAFDEATAVLAGDALLTLAFQVLAALPCPSAGNIGRLEVIRRISAAAGYRGMIQGQMADMATEGRHLSLAQIRDLHALKTGALMEVSVFTGAFLGGALPGQIDCLTCYARHIGLAFQVVDDLLNVEGDPVLLGKAVGTDRERGKNTYPALLGLEPSHALARELMDKALLAIADFDTRAAPLRAIARYVIERNH